MVIMGICMFGPMIFNTPKDELSSTTYLAKQAVTGSVTIQNPVRDEVDHADYTVFNRWGFAKVVFTTKGFRGNLVHVSVHCVNGASVELNSDGGSIKQFGDFPPGAFDWVWWCARFGEIREISVSQPD